MIVEATENEERKDLQKKETQAVTDRINEFCRQASSFSKRLRDTRKDK